MRLPEFVTFTGADDQTDPHGMLALSVKYPIEWGILFSVSKQGREPRYPSSTAITHLLQYNAPEGKYGLRFAAHLCGEHSRRVMGGSWPFIEHDLKAFRRFQINSTEPNALAIRAFQQRVERPCIAQERGEAFTGSTQISWLYDASGGRGIEPKAWPKHPGTGHYGYAGGIGPDNVLDVLAAINSDGPYWIDMESKVRTDERFDLEICRIVCERIWGEQL